MKLVMLPANMALAANLVNTFILPGASALSPPIWMPIEAKLANPHRAYVAMSTDRSYIYSQTFRPFSLLTHLILTFQIMYKPVGRDRVPFLYSSRSIPARVAFCLKRIVLPSSL